MTTAETKKERQRKYAAAYRVRNAEKLTEQRRVAAKERSARTRAYYWAHREERLAYGKRHRKHRPVLYRKYYREAQERKKAKAHSAKQQVYAHYGAMCTCCGELRPEFLTIDHIDGGGNAHRKKLGWKSLYVDIIEHNYPATYRVLCMNCNHATKKGKQCPHETERQQRAQREAGAADNSNSSGGISGKPENVV